MNLEMSFLKRGWMFQMIVIACPMMTPLARFPTRQKSLVSPLVDPKPCMWQHRFRATAGTRSRAWAAMMPGPVSSQGHRRVGLV